MASKRVTDRQAAGREVLAAVAVHGAEATARLAAEVGGAAAGVGAAQAQLARRLEGLLAALVAADERHLDAAARLAGARRRRDEAARRLGRLLVAVRRLAAGIYGEGADGLLGWRGRVAQRPRPMLGQARRAVARLLDPAAARPARRFARVSVAEGEWVERLEPAIAELSAALDAVETARRRAESTLLAKVAALAAYDLAFARLVRWVEALFGLAGLPDLAVRVRPGRRRRARPASPLPDRPPSAARRPPSAASRRAVGGMRSRSPGGASSS